VKVISLAPANQPTTEEGARRQADEDAKGDPADHFHARFLAASPAFLAAMPRQPRPIIAMARRVFCIVFSKVE